MTMSGIVIKESRGSANDRKGELVGTPYSSECGSILTCVCQLCALQICFVAKAVQVAVC